MPKRNGLFLILITLSLSLYGCNTHQKGNTEDITGLKELQNTPTRNLIRQVGDIRKMALRDTAISVAAQSGLAMRSKQINKLLMAHERRLDFVYNFNALLLRHNVLPPILLEGRFEHNLDAPDVVRISDRTFKIAAQARFVTVAPHWRNYLEMHFQKPERPDSTMLPNPRNPGEVKVWEDAIKEGWEQGIDQANNIFAENLARLTEDFTGMVRYRALLAQGMVSEPFVARTELGVTGDAGELHVNDQILRITAMPALNTRSQEWRALVSGNKGAKEVQAIVEKVRDITPQASDWVDG